MATARDFIVRRPHLIPAAIAAAMLLAAMGKWPYAYYQFMRWAVCAAAVFVAYKGWTFVAYKGWTFKRAWAVWVFGFVAILFNPIVPLYIKRDYWQVIDLLAAVIFVVAVVILRQPTTRTADDDRISSGYFWWMFIPAALAFILFHCAYDASVEAEINREGGNIPIYAGRREPEVVGEQWVDAESYKRHLRVDAIGSTCMGIVCVVLAVMVYRECKGKSPQKFI